MISTDILSIALVGTAQRDRVTIDIGTAIDRLISELSDTEPERALLLGVGAWAIYWQAGRVTVHLAGMPEPAQAEQLAVCSPAVSRLLHRLFLREHCDMLPEALQRLQEAGFRLPYELLPLALDIQVRAVRAAVYPVLGERGLWLSRFNPAWAWVQNYLPVREDALPQDAEIIWQEGTLGQRCEILRRARAIDPAKARAWLEAAWRQEKAETRLELLGTLEIGLSADDEPFLERALDDRAPSVRAAAPALLSRVPTSAFAHRMLQRADGILTGTQGKLKIKLPTAFDKAWQRDGIAEKPPSSVGERAWWLIQVLTYVPLSHWEEQFQLTPAELIEAASADKSGNSLLEAWSRATEFFSADSWSGPLWDWWQQQQQKKRSASTTTADMREELLSRMTPHEAEHKVQQMMLASSLPGNEDWDDLLGVLPVPWSEEFGRSYLNALRRYLAAFNLGDKRYHTYDDPWFNSLESAAIRFPVPCLAAFEDWTLPTEQWCEQWHEFTETLRTRQRFMEELAK